MTAAQLIRDRRRVHDLSQRALAVRAGTRQATISRIENGLEVPTVDRLEQLLLAMGEKLEATAVALDPGRQAADVRADRDKAMSARLAEGFALASFASELAGSARR